MDIKQVVITKIGIGILCIGLITCMILSLMFPEYTTAYIIGEMVITCIVFLLVVILKLR